MERRINVQENSLKFT